MSAIDSHRFKIMSNVTYKTRTTLYRAYIDRYRQNYYHKVHLDRILLLACMDVHRAPNDPTTTTTVLLDMYLLYYTFGIGALRLLIILYKLIFKVHKVHIYSSMKFKSILHKVLKNKIRPLTRETPSSTTNAGKLKEQQLYLLY